MLNIKEKLDKKEIPYEWDFKDMFDMREENTLLKQQLKDKDEKISNVIEYIKENTRYYDSEYSRIYSELCDCAGNGDTRLHVVVGDIELLEILESNKED